MIHPVGKKCHQLPRRTCEAVVALCLVCMAQPVPSSATGLHSRGQHESKTLEIFLHTGWCSWLCVQSFPCEPLLGPQSSLYQGTREILSSQMEAPQLKAYMTQFHPWHAHYGLLGSHKGNPHSGWTENRATQGTLASDLMVMAFLEALVTLILGQGIS